MIESNRHKPRPLPDLAGYEGRWVALLDGKIIAQGGTPEQVSLAAKKSHHKDIPEIVYVPMKDGLVFPSLLDEMTSKLPAETEIYLVGGAIRDALVRRPVHDFDFVVVGDALKISRQLADKIGAAYFPLDEERDTGRIIVGETGVERIYMDFSALRGPDLESDLRARDFTINAMAVNIRERQKIVDPLNGRLDLLRHRLRACNPASFQDDPARILRAIRLAREYDLKITPETLSWMHNSLNGLSRVSAERIRDELFRILSGEQPASSIRALDMIGALPYVLPELTEVKGVQQSPPHSADVWEHTLDVLKRLEKILSVLSGEYDSDEAANLLIGMAVMRLGRYREEITAHLNTGLNVDRSLRGLLFFSALYHDIGKPKTEEIGDDGRIHFYEHERIGSKVASYRARKLRLSNTEIERVEKIISGHMRPLWLAQLEKPPTKRAVYRFFRDMGPAGVEISLLALADILATYGTQMPPEKWLKQIDTIRTLFEAWWENPQEYVSLPTLIRGEDLLEEFNLKPGPLIGELLEAVREAQVSGFVHTREQSLAFIKDILDEKYKDS